MAKGKAMSSWGCSHAAEGCAGGFMPQAGAARRGGSAGGQRLEGWGCPASPAPRAVADGALGPLGRAGTRASLHQGTALTFCLESRGGGQRSVCDSSLQHITSSEQTSSSGQLWGQGLRTGSRTRSSHKKIRTQERAVGPAGADSDTLESLPRARFVWSVGAEAAAKKQETSVTSPVAAV